MGVIDLADAALSPLRRLEERGLVNRTPGTHDKRQRLVSLTTTGATLTTTLIAQAQKLEAELLNDSGDLTDLINQLQELTADIATRIRMTDQTAPAKKAL